MDQRQDRHGALFTGWPAMVIVAFAVFVMLVSATAGIDAVLRLSLVDAFPGGDRTFSAERLIGRPGWERITTVKPGGSADRAGLSPGALVQYDLPWQSSKRPVGGETIGLTLLRDGKPQHVAVRVQPVPFSALTLLARFSAMTLILSIVLSLSLGPIAILRGWGNATAVTFGIGIMGIGLQQAFPAWVTTPDTAAAVRYACALASIGSTAMCFVPAVLYAQRIAPISPGWIRAFVLLVAMRLVVNLFGAWCALHDARFAVLGDGRGLIPAAFLVCALIGSGWTWRGWRDSAGADRSRFAVMGIAMACMVWPGAWQATVGFTGHDFSRDPAAVAIAVYLPGNLLLPLSLAYAALRHRVVDIGFAVNRTMVFGSVSVLLLGSFGLIEWGVEHWLPEDWVKASVWIDAGAAVLVYLAFHRVHDWVEHRIEHVFFHHWQANEDALREFVGLAQHYEDAGALARGFADELERFSGGAQVALYRRQDGALARVAGNWDHAPRHFREDDRAFATLRATRRPLDLTETQTTLPGALALPMIDHGSLAGLVLIDAKGNGALYRPDEIAVLGWATHEVGLAMAALHVGLVESELRLAKAQLARLTGLIGDRLAGA